MHNFPEVGNFFRALQSYSPWRVVTELLLIGIAIHYVVKFLRGTRGTRILRGIAVVLVALWIIVRLGASYFGLREIGFLYEKFLGFASLAGIVVFQPELRRALLRLGETRLFRGLSDQLEGDIDALVETCMFLARRKIGGLVAIERDTPLGGIAESGTLLNADLNAPLLETIFWPNSPLHDLGVIIMQGRIMYAGVQFPLAESDELEKELGSRHRAAVGMSQESDAVVLVVSEETGDVSIAERGQLIRKLTAEGLRGLLVELLGGGERTVDSKPIEKKDDPEAGAAPVTS